MATGRAGTPEPDSNVHRLLTPFDTRYAEHLTWRDLGTVGALAYAAGRALEKAQVRAVTGTLTAETLLVLAGLRGWGFPLDLSDSSATIGT